MILSSSTIISKVALGIALAAPIGPVSVEMIRRGLDKGFLAAFKIKLGAILGNTMCLFIAHYGLLRIQNIGYVLTTLSILASLALVNMGYKSIKNHSDIDLADSNKGTNNSIIKGFYLSLTNPVGFVFWSGIFAADINIHQDSDIWLNSFIILGAFIWGIIFSAVLGFGKNFINKQHLALINIISGMIMIGYGCKFLYSNITMGLGN